MPLLNHETGGDDALKDKKWFGQHPLAYVQWCKALKDRKKGAQTTMDMFNRQIAKGAADTIEFESNKVWRVIGNMIYSLWILQIITPETWNNSSFHPYLS